MRRATSDICIESRGAQWLRKMSLLNSSAEPNPKHNPAATMPITSDPCRVATRGLPKALMNGGSPDTRMNIPTKILALRARPVFWPSVISESFGIPPAYRAYKGGRVPILQTS